MESDRRHRHRQPGVMRAQLLRVGNEVFPVYGDERWGFTIDLGDFCCDSPEAGRYQSLEELYFALVNLHSAVEGKA